MVEGRVHHMHLAHGIQEGEEKGKKGRKGGGEEKVRREREHKTALKNWPQSLFLSMNFFQ